MRLAAALVAASLVGAPSRAAAEVPVEPVDAGSETVTVEPLEIEGEVKTHLQERLRSSVAEGLARGTLTVVDDPSGATFVLHAKVAFEAPDYRLSLVLRQSGDDAPIASAERTCDLCGAQELEELAADLAATIARKANTRVELETKLLVSSQPPGAEVLVDGEVAGITPLEIDVEPGAHEVGVRKAGYRARTHDLSFDEGERESLSVTLEGEGPDRRSRTFRILGWTGVGAGIAGLGAGAAMISIHDQPIASDCSGINQDADGDCKFVHKTLPAGIAFAATGAMLLGAGIALLVLDRKRTQARRVEALLGPTMVGARGRF